jgi:5-methylcytosine-specific restriction endonuclease McrA
MTEEQTQKRRERQAAYMRAWREANPELAKERMRAFEAKNREKRIAYKAKLRANNPEHFKAKSREASAKARAEKPEAIAAYRAEWLERPGIREKRRAYEAQRYQENLDEMRDLRRVGSQNRRALARRAGKFTRAEWRAVCAQQDGLCFDCGERRRLTVGHLIPLSKGGPNVISNIVAQCMPCNHKQGTKIHPNVGG